MFGVRLLAGGSKSLSLAIFIGVYTCSWCPDVFYSMRRRRCDTLDHIDVLDKKLKRATVGSPFSTVED
jgi:hypothetical protein